MLETYIVEKEKKNYFIESKKNKKLKSPNNKINALELLNEDTDISDGFFKIPDHPFLIKVIGDSMSGIGIDSGDTLLVDKIVKPKHGDIVVAAVNKRLVVKRLNYSYRETMLLAENENYLPIKIKDGDRLDIWGVVTMVIKDMAKKG